ncbi:MAG: hypothetical protein HRT61_21745, partial [Ekhidna sp.]|nr:hypothetical protein [Ekhidna sp.]
RFSRSSSRSYLSTDQDIDPTAFLDDDYTSPSQSVDKKDEEKTSTLGVEKASTNAKAAESEGTEEQADTPSIKKAKSVARRRIRKATTKDVQSDSGGQAAKEDNTDSKKAVKKKVKSDTGGKADKQAADQIIDKFINESPSIKYQRSTESKSQDLSEESGSWDPNLASEYLAEIYLNQGNKKRAIEIYEALSLKYPEKKSYFADLISKID